MKRFTLLPALALLVACGSEPTAPEAPALEGHLVTSAEEIDNPVVALASGSGSFDNSTRTFGFNAKEHLDGTVKGSWERVNHGAFQSNGRVTCVTFLGPSIAFIGGYATSGAFSDPGASGVGWWALDRGEGSNEPPDAISLQYTQLTSQQVEDFCNLDFSNEFPLPGGFVVEQGNVQVKVK